MWGMPSLPDRARECVERRPGGKFTSVTGFRTELEALVAAERTGAQGHRRNGWRRRDPYRTGALTPVPEPTSFDGRPPRSRPRN